MIHSFVVTQRDRGIFSERFTPHPPSGMINTLACLRFTYVEGLRGTLVAIMVERAAGREGGVERAFVCV